MTQTKSTYWPYIICGFLALLSLGFLDNIRGPFFPDMLRDLKMSDSEGALFYSMASFIMILGSFIVPRLLKSWKPLVVFRIGLLSMSAGFLWFAFISSVVEILIGCFFFGMGFGIVNVIQNYAIQIGAEPRLRQRLFSGLHSNYAAAALIVPLAANLLKDFGWQNVYLLSSLLPLSVTIWTFFIKDSDEHYVPIKEREALPRPVLIQGLFVTLCFTLYLAAELSISTRMVHFLETAMGTPKEFANYVLMSWFGGMLASRIITSRFSIPLSPSATVGWSSVLTGVFAWGGLYVTPWSFCLSGFFIGPVFPAFLEYISIKFEGVADRILTMILSVSALGVVIMHTMVGVLTDYIGLQKALLVGPICLGISVIVLMVHKYKYSKNER